MTISHLMAALRQRGGAEVTAEHATFARDVVKLLAIDPEQVTDRPAFREVLFHCFCYYYWSWDRRAAELYDTASTALDRWGRAVDLDLSIVCELYDFLYFVVWCFEASNTTQCIKLVPVMRHAATAFERSASGVLPAPPAAGAPVQVAWLAKFASTQDPISPALGHTARALASEGRFELVVYAWQRPEEAYLDYLRELGAVCHRIEAPSQMETVAAIEARVDIDRPTIMVSDDNTAVPTALFCRRAAPVQIFLQHGLPAWPLHQLDAVFDSFGIDPAIAGWSGAVVLRSKSPWDLARLDPPIDRAALRVEETLLPRGARLIGCYGRLVKVTVPYLQAIERILQRCPDVVFVTGGTGDPEPIRAFAASSEVGTRIHVEARFVPGHLWGRLLHLFLDTWPVQGGEACRECIAKGLPVVSLASVEMPELAEQRDAALLADTWDQFVDHAVELLRDSDAYAAAQARSKALAYGFCDSAALGPHLAGVFDDLLERAHLRSATPTCASRGTAP